MTTVLICNAGSSSIKFSLIEAEGERTVVDGEIDWAARPACLSIQVPGRSVIVKDFRRIYAAAACARALLLASDESCQKARLCQHAAWRGSRHSDPRGAAAECRRGENPARGQRSAGTGSWQHRSRHQALQGRRCVHSIKAADLAKGTKKSSARSSASLARRWPRRSRSRCHVGVYFRLHAASPVASALKASSVGKAAGPSHYRPFKDDKDRLSCATCDNLPRCRT